MQRCTSSVHCDSFMMTTVFCDCISRSISSAVVMPGKGGGIHLVVGVEGIGPLLAHGQGEAADTVGGYVEPEHDVGGA